MEQQLKKALDTLKEFWTKQSPARKKFIIGVALGVVILAVGITVYLNVQSGQFATLYKSLDRQEAASVYDVLLDMGVPAQMDDGGNVKVPAEQVDSLRLELAAQGYPKTGLSYDIFSSSSGLTTTESDKKVILSQQLETRMQDTLIRIDGVEKAVVTLNIASGSSYVWEQDTEKSTASVTLTLAPGMEMEIGQVRAIKKLVASGVPKLEPEDVTVVDTATSTELGASADSLGELSGELERLGFERQIERSLEEKAARQLSLFYDSEQMRIAATVVINYDKMISESMQYRPEQGNTGVTQNIQDHYVMDPSSLAQGVPGEENNTDIPIYVDNDGDGVPEYVDHSRSVEYAISYIKQQVEKGKAELTSASMAVMIKDDDLNQQKRDSIIEQISKATNISVGSISVETLSVTPAGTPMQPTDAEPGILDDPILLALIGLGSLLLIVIVFMLLRMKRKKKLTMKEADEMALEHERVEQEMEERKRMLKEAADMKNTQENAIANEVREFAKENPEITASLIRSWLKEDN